LAAAAVDVRDLDLRLVRRRDGTELVVSALQGLWTEAQYLKLTDQTNHLVEFTDGTIEILPMPTRRHQVLLLFVYELLKSIVHPLGGKVLVAPFRLQIASDRFREPDVLLLLDAADPRNQDALWPGADLVVEVVSPDNPVRDTVDKPLDYAAAGIPEYWIVNPLDETITVLTLRGGTYATHGVFPRGTSVTSSLLPALAIPADTVFDAE
jgi:Uma2 family endonuclease